MTLALEVSVGKASTIYAQNGSDVLLPCTFTACIGFENAAFAWKYNSNISVSDLPPPPPIF